MEWTQENTLALIAVYKKMCVLWDPNHPRYYNKLHKHDAWEDVAKTMGTVSEECKKKMTVLLAAFRGERKNAEEPWYRKGYVCICIYICPTVTVTNKNVTEAFRNEKYS
jgi:hypothetical protein